MHGSPPPADSSNVAGHVRHSLGGFGGDGDNGGERDGDGGGGEGGGGRDGGGGDGVGGGGGDGGGGDEGGDGGGGDGSAGGGGGDGGGGGGDIFLQQHSHSTVGEPLALNFPQF
ncbi:glycine-rich protein DOT1-like [Papaver somniferum]|uniref:glycine-rich protein DOT1-like n=1 Tax=Papaver somniferum TaxID=3469 RepID=UPI000E6FE4D5|nr:glycine-rich protein DOT1-like [Papaver somniferum]